ncbi:MAG: creatininase family protein, partial [Calditrichaeota bacterium]|nr:creatininase family protein [Calditrichota bacterium]
MKYRMISFLMLLLSPCLLLAQTSTETVFLEELTWTEVRDAILSGTTSIILPTGGTEQNGPHIVLGKHNFIIKYTAEQIARRLGQTLVAPVLPYVPQGDIEPPTGHM